MSPPLHLPLLAATPKPCSPPEMSSPTSVTARASPGGSRIGRPPQWTISRSRKLARLYVYTTLSIEKIIKVLEDDVFRPRKNSAQKTIHKMLDNDPRYLRPESRVEMDQRINSLAASLSRPRKRRGASATVPRRSGEPPKHMYQEKEVVLSTTEFSSTSGSSRRAEDAPSFEFSASGNLSSSAATPPSATALRRRLIPLRTTQGPEGRDALETSDTSSLGIQEIQRRVSSCSETYARQISSLLRDFTISSTSDPGDSPLFGRRTSAALSERFEHVESPGPEAFEAFPEPAFALPGDFLSSHTRSCADFPGQEHGTGTCWCSIARETSNDEESWLLPTGELCERARHILKDPSQSSLGLRDRFGNTPLHLFAALEGYQDALFGIVLNSGEVGATNNADQTFLHVLNLEWFSDLGSPSSLLKQLLAFLRDSAPGVVYETDAYGRNFFHRAHSLIRDPEILASLLSPFNPELALRRDAFGFSPLANTSLGGEGPFTPPRRVGSHSPQLAGSPQPSADEDTFLAYHARLVQVIQSSYNNPRVEDPEGRNGLHCLAEAIIHQQKMDEQRSAMSAGRPLKRKLDRKDVAGLSSAGGSTSESILVARLRHLEGLLQSAHPVDINHYDKHGNTILMAFITHISDDQDDKAKTLLAILETLLRWGARVEARNRRGETALLVAARLGRKVALTTLLEHGANVYARDVDGRGILEVVDETCRGARDDIALYARMEACRVLLTGRRDWGVVSRPSISLAWRTKATVA